ncbi:MAG: carboxypeptidase regulatory-like domain-containing protein [Bryobacterales bacterium]|nr:carboxypeptidase regulatory-like domain-containing protein [Bryobacterales bacterium]
MLALIATPIALAVTIEGQVLRDDTGAALVSADVRVARQGERLLAAHLETDRDGRFRAEDLPEGRYVLTIGKPSFQDVALELPVDAGPIQVRLIRLASISGTVRARDGSLLANARVYAMERTRSGSIRELNMAAASAFSKADGSYQLRGLPPGNYVLAMGMQGNNRSMGAMYPDNRSPRIFELKGGEVIDRCDFVAETGEVFKVSGKVAIPEHLAKTRVPSGPPGATMDARFSVGLAPVDQPMLQVAWTRTEPDGSFEFPAVPWGSYELFAAGPVIGFSFRGSMLAGDGALAFGRMPVQVTADVRDLAVQVQPPRTVRLQWIPGRASIADCPKTLAVRLTALEARGSDLTRLVSLPLGDVVTVENLAPTRYQVETASAAAVCSVLGAAELNLRNGQPDEPVTVEAAGHGSLAGEVLDRLPGGIYEVALLPLGVAAGEAMTLQTVDAQGKFRFAKLRPGRYGVAIRLQHGGGYSEGVGERTAGLVSSITEVEVLGGNVEMLLHAPVAEGTANR